MKLLTILLGQGLVPAKSSSISIVTVATEYTTIPYFAKCVELGSAFTKNQHSKDINECNSSPCRNRGSCVDMVNEYNCSCDDGFTGTNCETNINECNSGPGINRGSCVDRVNRYECSCVAGFTGPNCGTNMNECNSSPCRNRGSCVDRVNRYECSCVAGFTGPNCGTNINECSSSPCRNGGSCGDGVNRYDCSCVAGFTGTDCETDINECNSSPCRNGGSCVDRFNRYECSCVAGFTETNCKTNIDECSSNPCRNRGRCEDSINGYKCICAAGYTGTRCGKDVDECSDLNYYPCAPQATCQDTYGSFTCSCMAGYNGDGFQCSDDNECENHHYPCSLQATCRNTVGSFRCTCRAGYNGNGLQCTDNIPPTVSNCPQSQIVVYIHAGQTQGEATWTEPTAFDVSGIATVSQSHASGDSFSVGRTQVRYGFRDGLNNMATCSFTVLVSTVDIMCPSPITISYGGVLSYTSHQCTIRNGRTSTTSSSLCTPRDRTTAEEDILGVCSCFIAPHISCKFQITVQTRVLCPSSKTISPGDMLSYGIPQCMNNQGRRPASCLPSAGSSVTTHSSVTCSCPQDGSIQCSFNIFVDCIELANTFCGNSGVTCHCMDESCDPDTGICSSNCTIVNTCPATSKFECCPHHEGVSNTTVTVSWRAWDPAMDDGDPPIVAYIPYYRRDASDEWISGPRILTNETLQFKADSLEVDTLYEFSVAVVREGENGEGPRSRPVAVKTLCNVPGVATSINAQLTSSNEVNVSWQIPTSEMMCSIGVTSYKVYYKIDGSFDDTPQLAGTVEDVDKRWFIVDDGLLKPGSSYIFFVTVHTDQESGLSESQAIQILEASRAPAHVFIIILVIILVTAIAVVFIILRYRRRNNSKNITTDAGDGDDVEYANADDPGGYIPLELQSKNVSSRSSDYQDLQHASHDSSLMSPKYEVTIVPEPQKPETTPRYDDEGVRAENRQLPDVPHLHVSGDEDEDNSYEVPEKLEEYTGVYINIKNKRKLVQPGPMKVAEFQNFMTRNKEDLVSDILQQFMALPSGEQYPWSVALKFQNKPKNFYKSVLPYDHSRVKLDTNGSDARSDYINASYIKNHHGKPSFIAAQGPREGTMDDFWEMVWQEKVETVVMVTDINEGDKLLCSTYWPSHMGKAYGAITVILRESSNFMSHTIRKLNLLKGKDKAEVHTVTQIHVHSWSYGGVPKEPASLVSIIKKVKSLQTDGSLPPLLVHCSNGVGATGTFIAAYVLMNVTKKNKEINVFEFVKRMRDDRVGMVQTRSTDSEISCDQLKKAGYTGIKLKSKKEFKVLQESLVQEQLYENYVGNCLKNQHKNRFNNIVPGDNNRPVLKSEGNTFGSSNYINAFHVREFCGREFIMTQTPLSSTVEDFWRLVYDYVCTTIVMLNTVDGSDETVVQYWPGGAHGSAQYGLMAVECTSTTKSDSSVHSQFQLSHKKVKKKSVSVDHFAFCGWSGNQPDVSKLMEFIRTTGNKEQGPILVHCINGVGLSALYVIVKTESKRLEQDGFVDLFQSLKKLRKNCPFAIQTQEEYTLCYQLLKDHLDNPEEYAVVY